MTDPRGQRLPRTGNRPDAGGPDAGGPPDAGVPRIVTSATLTMSLSVVTTFLVGGLAVLMREDLAFSASQLGFSISTFSIAAAILSIPSGRISDAIGASRGMLVSLIFAGLALAGIGAVASNWLHLAAFLACGGIAQSFAASSTNLALARRLPKKYQGLGFGIKTAAIPVASMLSGLSLPLIGLTFGWRWVFLGALPIVGLAVAILPREARPAHVPRPPEHRRTGVDGDVRPLAAMAFAAGIGAGSASASMAFWVVSAVARGVEPGPAGFWMFTGSSIGVLARIGWGQFIDRTGRRPLTAAGALLVAGSLGLTFVALDTGIVMRVAATLLFFAGGWAWTGMFHLAVVRNYAATPAAATGLTQLGLRTGGIIGPAGFGLIADLGSYRAAWLSAAGCMFTGGVLMIWARRALARSKASHARPDPTGTTMQSKGEINE